jgi:hypothetical protein
MMMYYVKDNILDFFDDAVFFIIDELETYIRFSLRHRSWSVDW